MTKECSTHPQTVKSANPSSLSFLPVFPMLLPVVQWSWFLQPTIASFLLSLPNIILFYISSMFHFPASILAVCSYGEKIYLHIVQVRRIC